MGAKAPKTVQNRQKSGLTLFFAYAIIRAQGSPNPKKWWFVLKNKYKIKEKNNGSKI